MLEVGDIKKDANHSKYVWHACERCGKERWVQMVGNKARHNQCVSCSRLSNHSIFERFWSKVKIVDSGCWEWQAGLQGSGYGVFCPTHKQKIPAHRFAYELLIDSIPEGLTLDHLCRNRICVNPEHLEPVTLRENILRGVGPSAINGKKTHCIAGHHFTIGNTYVYKGRRYCRICRNINTRRSRSKASRLAST